MRGVITPRKPVLGAAQLKPNDREAPYNMTESFLQSFLHRAKPACHRCARNELSGHGGGSQ
jgi:hypothetical protein